MKFNMPYATAKECIQRLMDVVDSKEMPVEIKMRFSGNILNVIIKKIGTTNLFFSIEVRATEEKVWREFSLYKKEVSWWHKKYIGEFENTIYALVEEAGGARV